jgi:hypothetical protein
MKIDSRYALIGLSGKVYKQFALQQIRINPLF